MYTNPFNDNMSYPEARNTLFAVAERYRGTLEMDRLIADYRRVVNLATKLEFRDYQPIMTNGLV